MCNLVDSLLRKTEEAPALFMIFDQKVAHYGDSYVYCFIEDYDMAFYSSRVDDLLPFKWDSIRCKGKKNLLAIYHYLKGKEEYAAYAKRFFIDADFDSNEGLGDDIYVTPGYSIENLFLEEECIVRILKTEYNLDPFTEQKKYDKCIDLFRTKHHEMQEAVKDFNAWYAALHDMDEWDHKNVSLDTKFPKDFINYDFNGVIAANYTIENIEEKFPKAPKVDQEKFCRRLQWLDESLTTRLRGKYEMEFLFKYLTHLNTDAGERRFVYTIKKAVPALCLDRMISSFGQYVQTPELMKSYIITGKTV